MENFSKENISVDEVEAWIKEYGSSKELIEPRYADTEDVKWIQYVHGAKLLAQMFEQLSENRYTYNKIEYGVRMTRFILDRRPDEFAEIAEQIDGLLKN